MGNPCGFPQDAFNDRNIAVIDRNVAVIDRKGAVNDRKGAVIDRKGSPGDAHSALGTVQGRQAACSADDSAIPIAGATQNDKLLFTDEVEVNGDGGNADGGGAEPQQPAPHMLLRPSWVREGLFFFLCYHLNFGPAAAMTNVLPAYVISRSDVVPFETYVKKGDGADLPGVNEVKAMVTTFAVFNTLGRILTGTVSDRYREHVDRPVWLIVFGAACSAGLFLLTYAVDYPLELVAVGVTALGVGGVQTIVPQIVADIFGTKNLAVALSSMAFAPASGTLLYSTVYGQVEERHIDARYVWVRDRNDSDASLDAKFCVGTDCLRDGLLVGSCASAFGAALCCVIAMKWLQTELPAEEIEALRRSLNGDPSADGATTVDDTGCLSGASYDIPGIHSTFGDDLGNSGRFMFSARDRASASNSPKTSLYARPFASQSIHSPGSRLQQSSSQLAPGPQPRQLDCYRLSLSSHPVSDNENNATTFIHAE
ncbi:hypothetical protein DIPPA_13463 [Diplonema papillatum]|nr:hypothetical protein DIPPA_13463 [Diplonema papillatum]